MNPSTMFAAPRRVESPDECFFYHTMELPGVGLVRGQWDLRGRFDGYGNVYEMPPALGEFDVVIVGAVLEHLSDQITALGSIARLTRETMVVVTPLLQTEERIARFEPLASNPDYDFTWWTYSAGVYREVFQMLGFRIERITSSKYYY